MIIDANGLTGTTEIFLLFSFLVSWRRWRHRSWRNEFIDGCCNRYRCALFNAFSILRIANVYVASVRSFDEEY